MASGAAALPTAEELSKLLSAAAAACAKAGEGDAAEEGRAVDALRLLQKKAVTADLLVRTDGGKIVKKLTKHASAKVAEAAKAVVEAWKSCVAGTQQQQQQQQQGAGSTDGGGAATASKAAAAATGGSAQKDPGRPAATATGGTAAGSKAPSKASNGDGGGSNGGELPRTSSAPMVSSQDLRPAKTGDEKRDRIRLLLAEVLAVAAKEGAPGDPSLAAVDVEEAMYRQNGGVNPKYTAKYRSLAFNLKDANNPGLRRKVLMGEIRGELLVTLSAEELASDERRNANASIREAMKKDCERGQTTQASTDMFQCGRCKQRKCTYYQMQTRSADEPMTTFVTCVSCGHRWKFC